MCYIQETCFRFKVTNMLKVKEHKMLFFVGHYRRWQNKEIQKSIPQPKKPFSYQKLSEITSLELWNLLECLQFPEESLMKKLVNVSIFQ